MTHVAVVLLMIAAALLVIVLVMRGKRSGDPAAEEAPKETKTISQIAAEELEAAAKKDTETVAPTRTPTPTPEVTPLVDETKTEEEIRKSLSDLSVEDLAEYLREKEVPEELVEFMEEYPEAREFVTDYLYRPEKAPVIDISGEVHRGTIPHFLQWDERWGYEDYDGSFMAVAGCGPTALSEVYCGLTGKTDMDPLTMARWAADMGYHIQGQGTSWEMMWSGANQLGLYAWEVDFDKASIAYTLQQGYPIIASMSPGDFTNFGHFIVLTGIDEHDNVTVRDSNSIVRTQRKWALDDLMWQSSCMWAYNYPEYE